jgi:demethylmenaquinone methyltransferase/2-methoxy-6-polyprenyl-1,4-benzoquinol methylase
MVDPLTRNAALKVDPRLQPYFSNEDERRAVTQAMFNQAAPGYDRAESLTAWGAAPGIVVMFCAEMASRRG